MRHYRISIPNLPSMTVKELLEDYFLIPRKIRHFLRIKKHIHLNGELLNWQSTIQSGDVLDIWFDDETFPEKTIPFGNPKFVDILFEDDHLIIVNKPEGMKTHGNDPTEIALLNHVSAYVGTSCYVVHRLDMETSGAIVVAKTPLILPVLNRLLEEKKIQREYLALCQGNLKKKNWTITDAIGRHRNDRRKRIVDPHKGQNAKTHVRLLDLLPQTSLIACQLETGRTHQIRVHLAHHGHALIGDPLYSNKKSKRLMLHAHKLQLIHPFTLETIEVTAPSRSFQQLLSHYSKTI